ncbi:hypothetical protein [Thermogemmatispora sp.]|uniref:hypothetical protein n=1 Tax=Thermogemmatispora sp. TaxID=1968838 RepID=UPI0035E45C6A
MAFSLLTAPSIGFGLIGLSITGRSSAGAVGHSLVSGKMREAASIGSTVEELLKACMLAR